MKLGELKAQALMLIDPDVTLRYRDDGSSLADALFNLKSDPNFEGLLSSMSGSVNRALSLIESRGLSPTHSFKLEGNTTNLPNGSVVEVCLSQIIPDFLSVEKIIINKGSGAREYTPDILSGDRLLLPGLKNGEWYTVLYKSRVKRVSQESSDTYELELDGMICELIPYFIKGELTQGDDPQGAEESMARFLREIEGISLSYNPKFVVESIYTQEG